MYKPYIPTSDELEMVELQHLLQPHRNDLTTQEGLVASLVHDIASFDYFYHYSDDGNVWRNQEKKKESIIERLEQIEDTELRHKLSSCFNKSKSEQVSKLVPWGIYRHKATKYVYLRWDGMSDKDARRLMGFKYLIDNIVNKVIECGVQYHVIYSDNIPLAHKKLREGLTWFNTSMTLKSVAVTPELYTAVQGLVCHYKNRDIIYSDMKILYPYHVEVMITEFAEIIRLKNFYIVICYPSLK